MIFTSLNSATCFWVNIENTLEPVRFAFLLPRLALLDPDSRDLGVSAWVGAFSGSGSGSGGGGGAASAAAAFGSSFFLVFFLILSALKEKSFNYKKLICNIA